MQYFLAFIILSLVKIFSHIFYRLDLKWIGASTQIPWDRIKLVALLNHTSLFEPIFIQAVPFHFLWKLSRHMKAPGASKTLDRPIVGRFWRLMLPTMTSISRKRDNTWEQFMNSIDEKSVILIAPEGRMKRPSGLDAYGKAMNIKPGIAEIIDQLNDGVFLIAYSGGLHHVQTPGEKIPRIFKTIRINLEMVDIKKYKEQFNMQKRELKLAILTDLEERMKKCCPN